jgi:hypothetical protein
MSDNASHVWEAGIQQAHTCRLAMGMNGSCPAGKDFRRGGLCCKVFEYMDLHLATENHLGGRLTVYNRKHDAQYSGHL